MNKGLKKAAVISLSASLALTSLAGCSKKEKFDTEKTAITVNGDTVSAGVVNFAVRYNQAGYESLYMSLGLTDPFSQDLYGSGSTLGDDVKAQLTTQLRHAVLAEQKMEDYGVSLSDEDREKITVTAADFIAANDEEVLEKTGIDQASVERYLELTVIQNLVEKEMSADVDTEVSDEEAAQRKIQYVLFTPESETGTEGVTEAETESEAGETDAAETEKESEPEETEMQTEAETAVLTENETTKTTSAKETETETETAAAEETEAAATEEGTEAAESEEMSEASTEAQTEPETEDPETAAAKERARVHAEELIEKLQSGEEFETAAEDMGKTANTTTFGSDYYTTELVEATDGLADDTLVETPVETENGYYVVKLISQLDREATDNKKESIVDQRRSDCISALYTEWEDAGEVSVDAEVMSKITFEYHLTQPTEAETETETAGTETEAAETETETAGTETEAAETETEAAETEAPETETLSETESETAK